MEERIVRANRDSTGVQFAQLRQRFGWQASRHMLLNDLSDRLRNFRPVLLRKVVGIEEQVVEINRLHPSSGSAKKGFGSADTAYSIVGQVAITGTSRFSATPFALGWAARVHQRGFQVSLAMWAA